MDIRVLGPVEVVVDGRVRSLPGGGERELLALLALSAGRVVAVPALVDGLWAEALPVIRAMRCSCGCRSCAARWLPPVRRASSW